MWFGTDGGLAKYDGRRTQTIIAEGLTSKRVLALKLDQSGVLWVGTEDGAGRVIDGEFHGIPETVGKVITSIIVPEPGRAILASEQGVIFDCRTKPDGSLELKTIPEKPLTSADFERPGPLNLTSLATKDNVLYAGTLTRGLIAIDNDQVSEIRSTPRPFFVYALEKDSQGHLWYGAKTKAEDSGLFQAADVNRPAKVGTGLGTVASLLAGQKDDMWVGTDGRGVFHFNTSTRLIERFTFEGTAGGLRSNRIYAIFIDREDVIWFGTDRGVCRYDSHAARVEAVSDNAESNFVRTLFQTSDGKILAGTNRGLFSYDPKAAAWQPDQEISQAPVYAMAEEPGGRLLVGTGAGLYGGESKGPSRLRRIEASSAGLGSTDAIRAIAQTQGSVYVAVFGRGVERLRGNERALIWPDAQADPRTRDVVSLSEDTTGKLWIGTALAGVFIFDGKTVTTLPALEKLKGSAVFSVYDAGNDNFLIASARALYLLHAGELKEVVHGVDARNLVHATSPPGKTVVWCPTAGGGLLKVLIDDQLGPVISRLDAEQGLPSQSEFAVLETKDASGTDLVLIGTNRGVARYSPSRIPPALAAVRIVAQRVHQVSELRSGLSLDYPQNGLLLDVAATSSRTFPEQFQYAFQLYDSAGKLIRQKLSRDAQFTMEALRPGNYRLVARAFSKDLIESAPLEFGFRVAGAPFPWTTALLSVLLALALLALWWGYGQNRRLARTGATLKDTNVQLADARMQLANETETERRRIARDLHDQTLADLRHLLMLTDQLPANEGEDKQAAPAVFRSEIEGISNEIRRICEDLSPSVLENVGFSAALEWALSNAVTHLPSERKFEYEFVADEGLDERINLSRATQMQIYRILQEAVSNISRHASATNVKLGVATSAAGDFLLTLEDNGRDFDPQAGKVKQGRGLANIRARASLIEAEVSWSKLEGGGTRFRLRKADPVRSPEAQR